MGGGAYKDKGNESLNIFDKKAQRVSVSGRRNFLALRSTLSMGNAEALPLLLLTLLLLLLPLLLLHFLLLRLLFLLLLALTPLSQSSMW